MSRRLSRFALLSLLCPLLALVGIVAAWAYWTTDGSGSATASAGSLNPPTAVSASAGVGQVTVSWTGSAVSGTAISPTGYYVTRVRTSDSTTAPACASTPASPTATSPCTDTNVPSGGYHYVVTAVHATWTAAGPASNDTTVINDVTDPAVTIEQALGQVDPSNTLPIHFTVTFNEPVTGFEATDVARSGTSTGGTLTVTGSGATYDLAVTGALTHGSLSFTVPANSAIDAAGNDNTASLSVDNVVVYDTVRPTVASISRIGATPTSNSSVSWNVTYSEVVTGVDSADFALATAGLSGVPVVTGVTGSGSAYTVTATTGAGSGTLQLNALNNGTISDLAANGLLGIFSGEAYTLDRTGPSVTVNQQIGQADPTNGAPLRWAVTFDEPVTGFDATDLTRTGTAIGGAATVSGSGTSYEISLTAPSSDGSVIFTIAAGRAADSFGNQNSASTSTDGTITYDSAGPAVTLTTPASGGFTNDTTPALSGAAGNLATDSTPVTVTIYSGTGTAGALLQTLTPNRSGATWSATAALLSAGAYTAQATQTDSLGNVGTSSANTFTIDTTNPTMTLALISPATSGQSLDSTLVGGVVSFDPCDTTSGFRLVATVADANPGSAQFPLLSAGSRWTHPNETVTTPTGGPFTSSDFLYNANNCQGGKVDVPGTYTVTGSDAAGNTVTSSVTFTADETSPSAASIVLANGGSLGTADTNDTLTITYSENMDAGSFCSSWVNDGANQTATGTVAFSTATNDVITVSGVAGCTFTFGSVTVGNYNSSTTSARTFSGLLTYSPTAKTLQVKLTSVGTGGTPASVAANSVPSYVPSTLLRDYAYNTMSSTAVNGTSGRL